MRCAWCDEKIEEDEASVEFNRELYHQDCLDEAKEVWGKEDPDEDERLNDPRHGLAAEINKIIR